MKKYSYDCKLFIISINLTEINLKEIKISEVKL